MKYTIILISIILLASCTSQTQTPMGLVPETHQFVDLITEEVNLIYDPLPDKDSISSEYRQRKEIFMWPENFTNAISRTILGINVDVVEHKLGNGQIFAVSIHSTLQEDPISGISVEDVQKIIYGFSINNGLVIENRDVIKEVVKSLKERTVKHDEFDILLRSENGDKSQTFINASGHCCSLSLRVITKKGGVVETLGHLEENDRNPEIAHLILNAINTGQVTYIGDSATIIAESLRSNKTLDNHEQET